MAKPEKKFSMLKRKVSIYTKYTVSHMQGVEITDWLHRGTQRLFSVKYLFGEANIAWNFLLPEEG